MQGTNIVNSRLHPLVLWLLVLTSADGAALRKNIVPPSLSDVLRKTRIPSSAVYNKSVSALITSESAPPCVSAVDVVCKVDVAHENPPSSLCTLPRYRSSTHVRTSSSSTSIGDLIEEGSARGSDHSLCRPSTSGIVTPWVTSAGIYSPMPAVDRTG